MNMEVAASISRMEQQQNPGFPPDWLLQLRPAFLCEQVNRNQGMVRQFSPTYLGKASKLPATRNLTGQTTFARRRL
jgi:hypothetical protein